MVNAQSSLDTNFPCYADHYQSRYEQFITQLRPVGRCRATLLEVQQPAGDWSDAATSDLILAQNIANPARIELSGDTGRFTCIGEKYEFFLTPPGCATRILIDAPHSIRILAIPWQKMCEWADSDELRLPSDGCFGALHQTLTNEPRITQSLDSLWRQLDETSPAGNLFADSLLLQIVGTLIDLTRPGHHHARSGLTRRDLLRVDAFMRAKLAEDLGLSEIASVVDLSNAHFCRAFKQSTGLSPYQALIRLRMQLAAKLLSETTKTIGEVALDCGYAQPAHFAKHFRRVTGQAPLQWRRQQAHHTTNMVRNS